MLWVCESYTTGKTRFWRNGVLELDFKILFKWTAIELGIRPGPMTKSKHQFYEMSPSLYLQLLKSLIALVLPAKLLLVDNHYCLKVAACNIF